MSKPIEECLKLERDWTVPDDALPSNTSRIRRRVLRATNGFTLTEMGQAIGKPGQTGLALVSQTLRIMEHLGFVFDKQETGNGNEVRRRLTNPHYQPSEADYARMHARTHPQGGSRDRSNEARARRRAEARDVKNAPTREVAVAKPAPNMTATGLAINGHTQELLDRLPRLTEAVHVVGMAIDADGNVSMMLRSANGVALAVDVHGVSG